MICSTCGYENQTGNRFCGMCGTPLPHRPLHTPGAQSTLSLTRVPRESTVAAGSRTAEQMAGDRTAPGSAASPVDVPAGAREQRKRSEAPPGRNGRVIEMPRATETDQSPAPPRRDLVPEIPLDEYVQNFRYVPPSDPQEITMRGETPVLEPESNVPPAKDSTASTPAAPAVAVHSAAEDDVRERLGLESDTAAEERVDRPRYLDFNQPAVPVKSAPPPPAITGPSFLGLSDAPRAETDDFLSEKPARGKWRMWSAVAVVVIVAALGVLEWRSQAHQTNTGPVEVVKMKLRSLIHGMPAPAASTESTPPASSSGSASKPEMRVEPPNARAQNPPPGSSPAASKHAAAAATPVPLNRASTAAPGATQAVARQQTAAPPQSAVQNTKPTAAAANNQPRADTTKPPASPATTPAVPPPTADNSKASHAANDNGEAVAKKVVPGAEEMVKANNASDTAAEAAWLWKATAKGNPEAPVRLADMYVKGEGVPRSCEQAIVLLKTAATKENALARNRLATMYGAGTCVQRNRVEAYRWLTSALAANPNSEWTQQHRDQLWQQMTPDERAQAQPYH